MNYINSYYYYYFPFNFNKENHTEYELRSYFKYYWNSIDQKNLSQENYDIICKLLKLYNDKDIYVYLKGYKFEKDILENNKRIKNYYMNFITN